MVIASISASYGKRIRRWSFQEVLAHKHEAVVNRTGTFIEEDLQINSLPLPLWEGTEKYKHL